jgi:hypothetical protein
MRTYSAEQKAEAVALAATIGPLRAGDALGIPRRTVASWMHNPAASAIIRAAEASIAERLKAAHADALAAVMEGLHDPRSRLGDRAAALRVFGEQLALAEGRATSRTESANVNVTEYEAALDAMDPVTYRAMLAEMAAYNAENPVDHVIEALRRLTPEQRDELEARIAEAERSLTWKETPPPGPGIFGMLPNGAEMYFAEDDERWKTGEIVRRFDPRRGPSGRLTDGQ